MAAGLGFKTFNTGDVLTAGDTNGYLMQGVWVFANATARTSAVTSPQEGNVSFLKDTNSLEIYDGAAWVAYGSGDITEVAAGTGISVSSGTGPVPTVTNTVATTFDAKGDLVVGTGADTFSKLTVGTNDYVLTADSSTSTGLKWAAAAGGGTWSLLSTTTLSGSSTTISISGTYKRIMAVWDAINPSTTSQISLEPNAAGSNATYVDYYNAGGGSTGSTAYYDATIRPGNGQNFYGGSTANRGAIVIENTDTTVGKPFYIGGSQAHVSSGRNTGMGIGQITTNAAISSIKFSLDSGSFNGGTVKVYGE